MSLELDMSISAVVCCVVGASGLQRLCLSLFARTVCYLAKFVMFAVLIFLYLFTKHDQVFGCTLYLSVGDQRCHLTGIKCSNQSLDSNMWVTIRVHIVAQPANRYMVAFHIAISYDILLEYEAVSVKGHRRRAVFSVY